MFLILLPSPQVSLLFDVADEEFVIQVQQKKLPVASLQTVIQALAPRTNILRGDKCNRIDPSGPLTSQMDIDSQQWQSSLFLGLNTFHSPFTGQQMIIHYGLKSNKKV